MAMLQVRTEQGILEGIRGRNPGLSEFRGIPYARPPVGELRWKPPMPAEKWSGVRKANRYSGSSLQPAGPAGFHQKHFFPVEFEQSEDCLYLNIVTPADSADEGLPVAIFIHGGGFVRNSGNRKELDGEAIAKRGCIYVSINYRLGVMGFLAHPELSAESPYGVSGNYGMLDQIAALDWLRANIAAFGGNPDQITIFGQSAGAVSCMCLTLCDSPFTEGKIKRAILQSGGGIGVWLLKQSMMSLAEAEEKGAELLKRLQIDHCADARQLDGKRLIQQAANIPGFGAMGAMRPVVDGKIFLRTFSDGILDASSKSLSYMVGSTSDEGYGFIGTSCNPETIRAEATLYYGEDSDEYLRAVGFDPSEAGSCPDFMADSFASAGIVWGEMNLKFGKPGCYTYYFTKTLPDVPAFHCAELPYIMHTMDRFDLPYSEEDYELADLMCDYWTNFIKTGDPNGEGLPLWKQYSGAADKIMEFGSHIGMIGVPNRPGTAFEVDYLMNKLQIKHRIC